MKIKCKKHDRRVVSGKNGWIHRNGDGSVCTDTKVSIGGKEVVHLGNNIVAWPEKSAH